MKWIIRRLWFGRLTILSEAEGKPATTPHINLCAGFYSYLMIDLQKKALPYWERKAEYYPLPFDRDTLKRTGRIIRLIESHGISVNSKNVLDIGCGTGIYSLPLARKSGSVLGIDFSGTMIKRLKAQIRKRRISNVQCFQKSWQDFNPSRFKEKFDVVWASMTMAIKTEKDIKKTEQCSKKHCVYIGWAGIRKNKLMEKIYGMHKLEYKAPDNSSFLVEYLKKHKKTFKIIYINDSWTWNENLDKTLEDIKINLHVHGVRPDVSKIKKFLLRKYPDKKIIHKTFVKKAIIIWNK